MTDTPDNHDIRYGGKGVSLKTFWYCPHCMVSVTTYVTMPEAPSHACIKRAGRQVALITKEKKQ